MPQPKGTALHSNSSLLLAIANGEGIWYNINLEWERCRIRRQKGKMMFGAIISGFAGLAFGLYAGKKRAHGKAWSVILADLAECISREVKEGWRAVSDSFKKDESRGVDQSQVSE